MKRGTASRIKLEYTPSSRIFPDKPISCPPIDRYTNEESSIA
jgi:hypothetical protein